MYVTGLQCLKCEKEYPPHEMFEGCPHCRTDTFVSNVTVMYDYDKLADIVNKNFADRKHTMWKYYELLPVDKNNIVSLSEGGTPLHKTKVCGLTLFLKDETRNPTWSFKDRLCSAAISKAKEFNAHTITIASTGNHGASTAAYAARAMIPCVIFTTPGVPFTMKGLMQMYGAKVVAAPTLKERWIIMRTCVQEYKWYPTGNYSLPIVGSNPYGIEGYKTIAYELCQQLNWEPPDYVVMPVGYADGITGVWKGFKEFYELGFIDSKPKMVAIEAIGPLTNALKKGLDYPEELELIETVAFSIGTNVTPYQGLKTIRDSQGLATTVSDEEIIEMQKSLGKEGLYVETASAAAVAGVKTLVNQGKIEKDARIVAVLTSTGLKDPVSTQKILPEVPVIAPEVSQLKKALKETYNYEF